MSHQCPAYDNQTDKYYKSAGRCTTDSETFIFFDDRERGGRMMITGTSTC